MVTATRRVLELKEGVLRRMYENRITVMPSGTCIFREGTFGGDQVFILVRGRIKIVKRSTEGRETVVKSIDAPAYLGEMALLISSEPVRTASGFTDGECEVVELSAVEFLKDLTGHTDLAMHIIAKLAERLRETTQRSADLQVLLAELIAEVNQTTRLLLPVQAMLTQLLGIIEDLGQRSERARRLLNECG